MLAQAVIYEETVRSPLNEDTLSLRNCPIAKIHIVHLQTLPAISAPALSLPMHGQLLRKTALPLQ